MIRSSMYVVLACGLFSAAAQAQDSVLYVTDGDSDFIKAIQGGSVIDQNLATGGIRRYRVVVRDTIWLGDMNAGQNAEFTLDLDLTGATSPTGVDIFEGTDGATDGEFNNTVESFVSSAGVYRFNADWTGGTRIFGVTGDQIVGITFDSASGNLWISDRGRIGQYDMAGNFISSFQHAGDRGSLAYEADTDTLWYVTNSGGSAIRQYSKDGTLLQTLSVPFGGNVWGAEFAFGGNPCPADFNGDGVVNTLDFIAYLNAYNDGDPSADFNGDGVVNTLDFIAFLNAFNAGCE